MKRRRPRSIAHRPCQTTLGFLLSMSVLVWGCMFCLQSESTLAGGSNFSSFPTKPFHKISIKRYPPTEPGKNRSEWTIGVVNQSLAMRWKCGPFQHFVDPSERHDATISVRVRETRGNVQVLPKFVQSNTDLSNNRQQSSIGIGMRGSGKVIADLELSMDTATAAAGLYCTTVEVTLTSL